MHECLVQVSGNIHVALGKSVRRDGKLVHEFNIEDIGNLAASTAEMCDLLRGSDRLRKVQLLGFCLAHSVLRLPRPVVLLQGIFKHYKNLFRQHAV